MSFGESIKTVLSKYAVFRGRASRSEFWWWYLFTAIVTFVVANVSACLIWLCCCRPSALLFDACTTPTVRVAGGGFSWFRSLA